MNQTASFVITPFTNPSGEIVFRVTGWLDGKRVRKNFRTRAEADAERQVLEVQRAQGETGIRTAITRLTDEQIGEAETVFARVAGLPHPLAFYVDFALANHREPQVSKLLSEAVTLYAAAKDHEFAQDQISSPQLQRIKRDLKRLQKHFPNISVAELTAERLIGFFNLGKTQKPSLKTYNNRRGIVSTFLKFAFQNGWITENPIAKVPHHRIRRKRCAAATLSANQVAELMKHVEGLEGGRFVPFFALCLFAGIRPCVRTGEIIRLLPAMVNFDTGVINITPANCLSAVQREQETHERLLSDGERAIINRHLVTEVSLQLQALIENARARTDEMNKEMADCATTLGIALRLVWEPITEGLPAGLPNIRRLLLADHATWSDDERSTVGRFLHQLIAEERIRNPAASGTEQLLHALDYRRWHVFASDRRQNNRWERLTRKRYGTGSGGEKALMLTIPQMAAASSHYKTAAPHAPRFILLDEAFAGMDKPTRARCMGLLESFDLDLLMTSEREWGAHATVSGIAIYQLVADADAVAATRWVWNGRQTRLAPVPDTPETRAPRPASSADTTSDELPLG